LYEDQEEVGRTESEVGDRDSTVLMDHVQLARRVPRQASMMAQNSKRTERQEVEDEEGSVIDKPEAGKSDPHGVSYS